VSGGWFWPGSLTRVVALSMAVALVAAACSAAPAGNATSPSEADASGANAAWRTTPMTDARSGETFTIDALQGKLVAIEPMAVWCSNCRIQQHEAAAALEATHSDDLVYLGLDVDPNEEPEALADYAAAEGFAWPFAVAGPDVSRSLAATFGDQVLSPPSTPLILIGPDGNVLDLHFGLRTADELATLFTEHLP